MDKVYYIIDGSHLFSSILSLWRMRPKYNKKRLNIGQLESALTRTWSPHININLGNTIYYFKENEDRIGRMLIIPEPRIPGQKHFWQIKHYGKSIPALPDAERQKLSPRYRDYFQRAEKGLDIKLACDSLALAAAGKTSHIVFLVTDRDYVPLFESLQILGVNTYLTALDSKQSIPKPLANICDMYMTLDNELDHIFGITGPILPPQSLQQNKPQKNRFRVPPP